MSQCSSSDNEPAGGLVRVCGANTPADCLFDAWREAASPVFDVTPRHSPGGFTLDLTAGMAGEMFVSRARFSAMVAERGRPHLSHGDTDYYVLQLFISGSEKLFAGDGRFVLGSGAVCLRDWRYPFTGISEDSDVIGYAIPRHLVQAHGGITARAPTVLWPLSSPSGEWLSEAILRIWRRLPGATEQEAGELGSGLIGLLNGLLANRFMEHSEELRLNRAMKFSIEQHIKSTLTSRGLSVDALCNRFHLSRASLYRLFQEEGGLRTYVREQQLKSCFNSLSEADAKSVKVREIAERWGFTNASHFNRIFKAEFGIAPSDVLRREPPRVGKSDYQAPSGSRYDAGAIRQWLSGDAPGAARDSY